MWGKIGEGRRRVSFRLIWGEGYIWWVLVGERIWVLKDPREYYDGQFGYLIVGFSLVGNNKLHQGDHTFDFVRALYCLEIIIWELFTYWEGQPSLLLAQHHFVFSLDHSSFVRQLYGSLQPTSLLVQHHFVFSLDHSSLVSLVSLV